MSDHGHDHHPDESAKDRTYLSLFVIAVGLAVAVGATIGASPPSTRTPPSPGKRGVVVLEPAAPSDPARVLYGTVVARGGALHVIGDRGERVVPRARVRHVETETDRLPAAYFERYPAAEHPLVGLEPTVAAPRTAAASRAEEGGCVVTGSGEVLVGRLTVDAAGITVRWPYGERSFAGSVWIPRDEVRWAEVGVDRPTEDYWRRFPTAPIDERYRRGQARPQATDRQEGAARVSDPLVAEAELAHSRGMWEQATHKWAQVYPARGFQTAHFRNLEMCAFKWFDASRSPALMQEHVDGLLAALDGLLDRPEVARIAANSLRDAINLAHASQRTKSARAYAEHLRALGGPYVTEAERFLDEATGH